MNDPDKKLPAGSQVLLGHLRMLTVWIDDILEQIEEEEYSVFTFDEGSEIDEILKTYRKRKI